MRSKEAEGFDQVCQIYQNAGMYVCTSLNEFVPVYLEFVRISRIFDRLDESSFRQAIHFIQKGI